MRPAHCPECSRFKSCVFLRCYMDKIRFQAERGEGIRSGCVCVWVQLGSHLLSSSGAWNDSRGKQTGKEMEGEGGGVWGMGVEKKDRK